MEAGRFVGTFEPWFSSARTGSDMFTAKASIGYNTFNGNLSGYLMDPADPKPGGDADRPASSYRGKKATSAANRWAAGYVTDSTESILLADMAGFGSTSLKWQIDVGDRFEEPQMAHDSGLNTLRNDGRVTWATVTGKPAVAAEWNYISDSGVNWVAGPK
jgi:hypothetical protein